MANKPVISIDVDDQQFAAFYKLFQQFQGELGEIPEEWKVIGESATRSHEAIAAGADAIIENLAHASDHTNVLVQHLKDASKAQRQFTLSTGEGETVMKRVGREAKELKDTLFGIGSFLMKLGVLGVGTFSGALFGMDKLAEAAVGSQRQARSLGMSTGQLRAFKTDMGRYVDEGSLENIANAKNDLTQRVWLQRASGLSSQQIDQTTPGELASQIALKMHDWWASTPASQHNTAFLQSTGFPQIGFSLDDMRRLGATDRGELERASTQYGTDSKSLNISNRDTDSLYAFSRQLELAGQKLQSAFTNRLAELGPSLGGLVATLEKDAEILVNNVFSKENILALESGIDTLTHFLGSQEFKDDIKYFVDGMGKIAHAIMGALKLISPDSVPDNSAADASDPKAQANDLLDRQTLIKHPYNFAAQADPHGLFGGPGSTPGPFAKKTYVSPYYEYFNPANPESKDVVSKLAGYEKQANLPRGFLTDVILAESSGDRRAVSPKGAQGAMQLMPATAKQYGVTDPLDFDQNVRAGASYYRDLFKKYKNDLPTEQLRKSLAAYNWGPGNLDKDINGYTDASGKHHEGYGKDWEQHVPKETENYIKRILDMLAKSNNANSVQITITNKSGTNVAVSTNSAAAG